MVHTIRCNKYKKRVSRRIKTQRRRKRGGAMAIMTTQNMSELNKPSLEAQIAEKQDKEDNKPQQEINQSTYSPSNIGKYLQGYVDIIKQPMVKKAIKTGLVEIVDDAKPALDKLAQDSVSLLANVAENVAGPLIGFPRTLENAAEIGETGIQLAKDTMDKVSKIGEEIKTAQTETTNQLKNAQQQLTNTINQPIKDLKQAQENAQQQLTNTINQPIKDLKQAQERAYEKAQASTRQLVGGKSLTIKHQGSGKQHHHKTKKQSIFKQMHYSLFRKHF